MTSSSIEMSDLSKRPESSEDRKPNSQNDPGDPADSVISTWTWVTASLLVQHNTPSVLFAHLNNCQAPAPGASACSVPAHLAVHIGNWERVRTPCKSYTFRVFPCHTFCRVAASSSPHPRNECMFRLSPSKACPSLTCYIQVPSALPPAMVPQQSTDHPLLVPSTLSGLVSAFLAYNTKSVGPLSSIVFVGAAIIGLWGLWAVRDY